MWTKTPLLAFILLQSCVAQSGVNDGVVENDPIIPAEIYDVTLTTLRDAQTNVNFQATDYNAKYYCTFRGKWTPDRHPAQYPARAAFSKVAMYTGTNQLRPWLKNRLVPEYVQKLAEQGFTDDLEQALRQDPLLYDYVESATPLNMHTDDHRSNHIHMPPIRVDAEHPWFNLIGSFIPSPDWFTGFYLYEPFDDISRNYWDQFKLNLYPWDAGTDEGRTYTSVDLKLDPQLPVARFNTSMAQARNNVFLSPDGSRVPPVAEFQCKFWVCGINDDPLGEACNMPNWPPANGCDVLRYPGCDQQCEPEQVGCKECKNGEFYFNCCDALTEPLNGNCKRSSAVAWRALGAAMITLGSLAMMW